MSEVGGVPALRFPEFSGGWKEVRLYELATVATGSTPPTAFPEYYDGPHLFVSPADITEDRRFIEATEKSLTALGFSKARAIPARATLFVCIGSTIGKLAQAARECATNQQINAVIANGANCPDFLFSGLERAANGIKMLTAVQAVPIINKSTFSAIKIRVPTLPEQQKIADFLGAVDARVGLFRRRRDAVAAYKKAMMQRLFARTLRFTRPDGSPFPEWQEQRLGEVFDWIGTNSLSREMLTDEGGEVQNIHYGDIHSKFAARFSQSREVVPHIRPEALLRLTEEAYCRVGDMVIADASEDYADIGKAIEIIEAKPRSLIAGLHTYIARPKSGALAVGFSGYLFQTWKLRRQIMRIAQGISVLGISKPNLSKLQVEIPHPEEQQKIADFLTALDTKIDAIAAQIAAMQRFKQGLLQQMFV